MTFWTLILNKKREFIEYFLIALKLISFDEIENIESCAVRKTIKIY